MNQILDYTEGTGLVFCAEQTAAQNNSEILYLNEAQKLGVNAVLFRRFFHDNEVKPYKSEPSICIFEKELSFFNSDEHIALHAALWSAGKNEVYIVKNDIRLDIINARKPAQINKSGHLAIDDLLLASTSTFHGIQKEKFAALLFNTGTFWEQSDFVNKVDESSSPYIYLLDYLLTVRKFILNNPTVQLLPETIDKLLVTSILIKFLEEITDDAGTHTLRTIYKKYKIETFADAVESGHCLSILNELANEFAGKIFDNFTDEEKSTIQNSDLGILANFLQGNVDIRTNQIFIWKQYSFKYLPAEVISAIYENFIQAEAIRQNGEKEKGVIYTPIHLVNLLIDEVMPLENPALFEKEIFKVLDPACGSGVFLVAAFKRLLQWWAINNQVDGKIRYPDSKTAQKILEENIFGVDVKRIATLVSVFSLTTALLDKLTPQEIWKNLKFEDLSQKNIQHISFFDWSLIAKSESRNFDIVVGNPPFNIETGKRKEDVLNITILKQLQLRHNKLPDNNFALHFFECAMLFSKKVCLIIPANVLLYNNAAQAYRNQIFLNYTINKIFDFTHLRRDLFHRTADTAIVAIIVENKPAETKPIQHIVVKRTISSEKKLRFEIDYYDNFFVPLNWATDENKHFIWKCNLLGGGRLFHLIYRLSQLQNLQHFLSSKAESNSEWIYEVGYEAGAAKNETVIDYLYNQDKITDIRKDGTIISETKETNKQFYRPKVERLFRVPLIVIHKKIGDSFLPIGITKSYKNEYLVFNSSYVGIHAPLSDFDTLKRVYDTFRENSETFLLWILNKSSSALVSQETAIKKTDLDTLPFPPLEQMDYLELSKDELLIRHDVLHNYIHLGKSIKKNGGGQKLHNPVSPEQLNFFTDTLCQSLNEIYSYDGKSWKKGSYYRTEQFIIIQIGFGAEVTLNYDYKSLSDSQIQTLITNEDTNQGAVYKRIIRLYKHVDNFDCLFLIKPNAQRYWLNSIALRDADDTYLDLKKAGF